MSLPETLWFIARNFPIYPTLGILTYIVFNGIYKSIKGAYSGPLAAFPGPDFAAMTGWYKAYIELYQKRSWTAHLRELHKVYGEAPIPIAAEYIALTLSQDMCFGLDRSCFTSLKYAQAKERKDILLPMFSRQAVTKLQSLVQNNIDRLCEALETNDAAGKSSDLFYGIRCFSLDTILQYCFNISIDALGAPGFQAPAVEAMEASLPGTIVFRHFPLLRQFVNSLPTWISILLSPATAGLVRLRALLGRQATQVTENPKSIDDSPHETVYHRLLDRKANNGKVPDAESLHDEAQSLMFAAGHTTANALTVGIFHVLANNGIKERLARELRQGWPDLSKTPTFEDLEQLPYLTAVITESLRMSPGIVSPLLRITPFGGATIGGIKVPSRVIVGMSGTFVHESEVLFHDAKTFNPDRWLADDSAVLERWLVPFSKGPRMCIGQNLAYCEMFLGFAALFRRFDLSLDGNTARDLSGTATPTKMWHPELVDNPADDVTALFALGDREVDERAIFLPRKEIMKLFAQLLTLGLLGQGVVASNWFSKSIYNKWHETELERWLADHDIPHPSPADRADLEKLVQENWHSKIVSPYSDWDTTQLKAYLSERSQEASNAAGANKDSLIENVKNYWYETEEKAEDAFSSVKDWIFDSWTDSQLKAFADKHGIPVPQPRKRDDLLHKIRYDYETIAKKAGDSISYPGNWLYETWSESDLKEWLDTHGIPAPQPATRDKLIASVRRNSRLATLKAQSSMTAAQKEAQKAADSISDSIIANWDDSKIKEWADKNGVKVPQGSKHAELLAILRKYRAKLLDDTLSATAASGYGAATSKANNQWARATEDAQLKAQEAFDAAIGGWSETRLKAYLDARGVPVPQNGKKDDLVAAVRKHSHKAATGYNAWTYDTWTFDNLKKWLTSTGDKQAKKAANKAGATRDDLVAAAQAYYSSASAASGASFATVTSYLAAATDSAKSSTFDTWSDSELKAYLDTYGVPVPQGSSTNELRAWARNQANWFRHGTTTPQGTLLAKLKETFDWAYNQIVVGVQNGIQAAQYEGTKGKDRAQEAAAYAKDRAYEEKEKAKHRVQEEL
ncbi:hypothetical protein V502_06619 [Pseudogymnoascus sp. VKM F-4520 (FW-2644)]|nr:hypothetical protein V502_06619 [Pseudogymnoascus sp. VKM F-4520 (FW-2644)]